MQWRRPALVLALALACLPAAAQAILIDVGGVRVGGYLVRDDGKRLTLHVRTSDGEEKTFDRAKVKLTILHDLDRPLLGSLSRENPKAYHDYALKLADQAEDPHARDTAMRLFLIAAYLDPQQYGRSALLGMSRLAANRTEERRCRAMAFLLDPAGDATLLRPPTVKPAPAPKAQAEALQDFLRALHSFRAGEIMDAKTVARHDGVDKVFAMAPGMFDHKAFLQKCDDAGCPTCKMKKKVKCAVCNGRGTVVGVFGRPERCATCNGQKMVACSACDGTGITPVPDDVQRLMLRAELWAVEQLTGGDAGSKKTAGDVSWSALLRTRQVAPVPPLSLEAFTDLDPRKCLYRNGTWVAP
jgi:hypothetical protein